MTEKRLQRRLAAILAADVVGFSRLMERDEAGTLAALKSRRQAVLSPVVAQHSGRVVKLMGDGVLVEFASAVDAVQCAVELQKGFTAANEGIPEALHIVLRIGVNLGDVIVEGSDLFGDGVNIAARLEALAEPGGINVSAIVHDQVTSKLSLAFGDLGEHTLKNIVKPVRVYCVETHGDRGLRAAPLYLSALASLGTSVPAKLITPPAKASIAVLPFLNMSGDPEQEYFTDGLTEDIITDLSNVPGFFVIARNSTFAYKGKPTDVRQIAHDLGVKYILEGSARRSAQRLRITAQLIDAAEGGNHVWAERFDRDFADIFAVQDEVTRRVVQAITGKLSAVPAVERYRPSSLEAYDLCVRSRNLWSLSKALNREAHTLLIRAVALDPKYAEAHWQLALAQLFAWIHHGENEEPNRRDALISAERAVDLDPNDSCARWVLGYVLFHERRWDEANAHFEASMHMNPNDADAMAIFSDFKLRVGIPEEALEFVTKALRLNPHPPGWYYWILGDAQVANGQYEYAVATLRREETYRTGSRRILAAALALSGRVEEAREEAKFFLADNPHFRVANWIRIIPVKDQKDAQFWFDAYLLAGLPE
jgi:adenylate cyclase